jgi:hypothetical protein
MIVSILFKGFNISLGLVLLNCKTQVVDNLDLWNKIFLALIGGIIALILKAIFDWFISKRDLCVKRKLIESDLTNQAEVVERLRTELKELYNKFEKRQANQHTVDAFVDLHSDIYNSIPKTDYYKIYKKKSVVLNEIYKTIEFLSHFSIDKIYTDYIVKLDNHLKEKENQQNHEYYCNTHINFIKSAQRQILHNLKAIEDVKFKIEKIKHSL